MGKYFVWRYFMSWNSLSLSLSLSLSFPLVVKLKANHAIHSWIQRMWRASAAWMQNKCPPAYRSSDLSSSLSLSLSSLSRLHNWALEFFFCLSALSVVCVCVCVCVMSGNHASFTVENSVWFSGLTLRFFVENSKEDGWKWPALFFHCIFGCSIILLSLSTLLLNNCLVLPLALPSAPLLTHSSRVTGPMFFLLTQSERDPNFQHTHTHTQTSGLFTCTCTKF